MKMLEISLIEEMTEPSALQLRPRANETVSIEIPIETLASLTKFADRKDMSVHALLKWYVGQGLRHDLAQLFSDRVLASTAEVLAGHLPSEEVTAILQEIQAGAVQKD